MRVFNLQECSALLLKPDIKESLRQQITRPNLEYLRKKFLKKKIVTECKKMHICLSCAAPNGVVKKCGMLKICHDRFRYSKNGEVAKEYIREFRKQFLFLYMSWKNLGFDFETKLQFWIYRRFRIRNWRKIRPAGSHSRNP
jgi:hypothetical protein